MDSPNQGLIESYLLSDTVLHSSSHLQESVCVYDRRRREWGALVPYGDGDLDNGRLGDSMRGLGGPPGEL